MSRIRIPSSLSGQNSKDARGTQRALYCSTMDERLHIGYLASPFGVQGALRLHPLGEPQRLVRLKKVWVDTQGWMNVHRIEIRPNDVIIELVGIDSRNAAEPLKHLKIYALLEDLPKLPKGEYYYHDLIGLPVVNPTGETIGKVKGVKDVGYGDLLEVLQGFKVHLVPLQAPYVEIHIGEHIVVDAPKGLLGDGDL